MWIQQPYIHTFSVFYDATQHYALLNIPILWINNLYYKNKTFRNKVVLCSEKVFILKLCGDRRGDGHIFYKLK